MKRVVLGAPDAQSLYEISAFLELKTVWHPIGLVRVEILGSGGAVTIPRPGCSCPVCVEARAKGVPYARTGPSVFVHGPDMLIDTPEESKQQLNRSRVTEIAAGLYSHWHPDHTAGRRVWESRNFEFRSWPRRFLTTPIYVRPRCGRTSRAYYGLADQFRFMEAQGTVRVVQIADNERFELDGVAVTAIPLDAENAYAFLFEADGTRLLVAMDETHGWPPPRSGGSISPCCRSGCSSTIRPRASA